MAENPPPTEEDRLQQIINQVYFEFTGRAPRPPTLQVPIQLPQLDGSASPKLSPVAQSDDFLGPGHSPDLSLPVKKRKYGSDDEDHCQTSSVQLGTKTPTGRLYRPGTIPVHLSVASGIDPLDITRCKLLYLNEVDTIPKVRSLIATRFKAELKSLGYPNDTEPLAYCLHEPTTSEVTPHERPWGAVTERLQFKDWVDKVKAGWRHKEYEMGAVARIQICVIEEGLVRELQLAALPPHRFEEEMAKRKVVDGKKESKEEAATAANAQTAASVYLWKQAIQERRELSRLRAAINEGKLVWVEETNNDPVLALPFRQQERQSTTQREF